MHDSSSWIWQTLLLLYVYIMNQEDNHDTLKRKEELHSINDPVTSEKSSMESMDISSEDHSTNGKIGNDNALLASKDESKRLFLKDLHEFMSKRGHPILRPPSLGFQELDLYKLYRAVTQRGGMDEVTSKQEWKLIYNALDIPTISTSASYNTRTNYKKYLYLYELEHFETEADRLAETMNFRFNRGDYVRIESTTQNQVYYARVIKKRFINNAKMYYIHYNGWSTTHDEWMPEYALQSLHSHEQYSPSELKNPSATRSSKSNYLIDDPSLYPKKHLTGKASKKSKLSPTMSSSSGSFRSYSSYQRGRIPYSESQDEWYSSIAEEQDESMFNFSGASSAIRLKLPSLEHTLSSQDIERTKKFARYNDQDMNDIPGYEFDSGKGLNIFSEIMIPSISTLITASEHSSEYSDSDIKKSRYSGLGVRTTRFDRLPQQTFPSSESTDSKNRMSKTDQRRQRSTQSIEYFSKDDSVLDLSKERERVERERFDQIPLKPDLPLITANNLHILATITTESESENDAHDSDYSEMLKQLRAESEAILERAKKDDATSWKDIIDSDLKTNISSKSLMDMSPGISSDSENHITSDSIKIFTALQESFKSTLETINKRMREIREEMAIHKAYLRPNIQTLQSEEDNEELSRIQLTNFDTANQSNTDSSQMDSFRSRRRNGEKHKR